MTGEQSSRPSVGANQSGAAQPVTVLFYFLVAYTLFLLVPVNYQATLPFLDSSWGYALNYFLNSRFHFGPDVIFTYGPLGFLNNPQHVGNDIAVALSIRFLFWVALGTQLLSIWKGGRRVAATAFCVSLILGHRLYYDYWDYSLQALTLLTVIKLFRTAPSYLDLCLLPGLMAVTFLLKFTAFSMAACMVGAYALDLLFRNRTSRSPRLVIWVGICFLSGPLSYLIYNRSLTDLVEYIKGSFQISTGFATAMALDTFPTNHILVVILCVLLAVQIALGLEEQQIFWAEALLIVLVTWTVFRHGFVRGGYGDHSALFFGFSILLFACLFMGFDGRAHREIAFRRRVVESSVYVSFLIFNLVALSGFAERYPVLVASNWWPEQNLNDLEGLVHWDQTAHNLDHAGDEFFSRLPGMSLRSAIEGKRVMVFPYSTPYVAKVKFEMFPIYALQAYAAFTEYLDRKGAQNLISAQPPVDEVIVEWAAIDERNPILDTPAMYTAFLSNYIPEKRVPEALLLKRRVNPLPIRFTVIDHQPFKPDEWIRIPFRDRLVAMCIHLKQTLLGSLFTNLYCQKPVYMELRTQSGTVLRFRVPPQVLSVRIYKLRS